jgi:hypothetical protein
MQLVAYGAQDVFLTGTPEITFWKVSYRRHTNFAMESIEQTFSGQADFGRRVTCTVSRNGDLAYRTYLQVVLPEINQGFNTKANQANGQAYGVYARWLDYIGEQLISQVEVEIGGQRIDRQYGDWMHIWNQMTMSAAQQRAQAEVQAADELTDTQRRRLSEVLARVYHQPVSVQLNVNPELLGGLSVAVGDEVIDGTLSSRLDAAATRLPD